MSAAADLLREVVGAAPRVRRGPPEPLSTPEWASPERRDRDMTRRIAAAALQLEDGDRGRAAALLREQAEAYIEGALTTRRAGAGDERVQQFLDSASRRLRAAAHVGGGR